ncbi:MAG: DUF1501 domain-containing protein [Variovorax sp.]
MQRRHLLRSLAAAPLAGVAGVSGRLFAASAAAGSKLLVVFLRGGYDGANLLVPYASPFYYEARPRIAVARPGAINGASMLDARWGLHPALNDSVLPMYKRGEVAFLPFAGTDDLSRSHFETQDSIELGQASDRRRNYDSGFLNRLAGVLGASAAAGRAPQTIAFTNQLPVSLRGSAPAVNMALAGNARAGINAQQSEVIQAMYKNNALERSVAEGFEVRDQVQRAAQEEMDAASRNAMTAQGFEGIARRMARLMRERNDLAFVDVGGWDTHVGEGAGTGYLANRLDQLGRGLAGFAEELGAPTWRHTVVVVLSEFGRTFRENGNGGTDHGHGTTYWLLGGGLAATAGGHVIGEQAGISQPALFQGRDFPVLNEYRSVFGGLFQRLYGLSTGQVRGVFDGVAPKDLHIV